MKSRGRQRGPPPDQVTDRISAKADLHMLNLLGRSRAIAANEICEKPSFNVEVSFRAAAVLPAAYADLRITISLMEIPFRAVSVK